MDQRCDKNRPLASSSPKMLQRYDSKSHSFGALSSLRSREQKLQDEICRYSSHGIQFDGRALISRGPRALSLQTPCHYGSAPTISTKELLHESLSEGSLPQRKGGQNISLYEAATIPFDLLYELAEILNPLGHNTLNELALLIGMTQEHFVKLYKSAINPAISLLTEGEKYLKDLEGLKVAMEILQITKAVDVIDKYQSKNPRGGTAAKISSQTSTGAVFVDSETDSTDENSERPVFTLGDQQDEFTDDVSIGRVGDTDNTMIQRYPARCNRNNLAIPHGDVWSDSIEVLLPQYKEVKTMEYHSLSPSSWSKSSPSDSISPIHSPYTEALCRSVGSRVDSGYGSTEHNPLTVPVTSISSSKSLTQSPDVFYTSGLISESGGVLYIPNTSISLLVPEGALKMPEMIQLKVITDPAVKGCPQSASHPRLTPLVSCEPDGLKFLKAAELTVPHCGIISNPGESIEVYVRNGAKGGEWKRDEYSSKNAVLKLNTCSIPIQHFSDYDVFIKNDRGSIIGKKMRTFPMANCLEQPADDILLSLWMCNDYDQEYDVIVKEKQELVTNVLLDQYTSYILEPSEQAVNVKYRNLSTDLWTLENHQEKIGYCQLWHGSQAKATFRMKCNSSTGGGKLNGTLTIKQKDHCESTKFELQHQVRNLLKEHLQKAKPFLQTQPSCISEVSVFSEQSQPLQTERATPSLLMVKKNEDEMYIRPAGPHENHLHIHLASREVSDIISPQSPPTFQVPYSLSLDLSMCLNGEDPLGNDWKKIASHLDYTALEISVFERCKNPTVDMLSDACKKRRLCTFDQLLKILNELQRRDAVRILEKYLQGNNSGPGLMAIEGPQNASKPELAQQCSGEFRIQTEEFIIQTTGQPSVTGTVDLDSLVQPLSAVQGPDVTSSSHCESNQKCESDHGGGQQYQMGQPLLPEELSERGSFSLPCHNSTPIRGPSAAEDGETVHQYIRGQGNDSGIDSPDITRQHSRRRFLRCVTLAPNFKVQPNHSVPSSECSLTDTKSSPSHGIASQSSEDSGFSSEDAVISPPLEKLNNCFTSES